MRASKEAGTHAYFPVPFQRMKSNEPRHKWRVDVVNPYRVLVIVATEKLKKIVTEIAMKAFVNKFT